jgi:hypothetical protein
MVKAPVEMHQHPAVSKLEAKRLNKSAATAVYDVEVAKSD